MGRTLSTAAFSVKRFMSLAVHRQLHLKRDRIDTSYSIRGSKYKIFRETEKPNTTGESVVLVIGFRLKAIRSSASLHWLFQRICVATTPFWCGLPGFKTKLWMVDPLTKNYVGVYDWRGKLQAQDYINFLLPILEFFSVRGTVWAKQVHGKSLEGYLTAHIPHL